MALPNLSGSNIQDTFQRVLQTDGTTIYDGTGSAWLTDANGNAPDQNGVVRYNSSGKLIADSGWTFGTHNGSASIMHLQANEINFETSTGINLSGDVSASGTITAINIIPASNPSAGLRFQSGSTDVLNNLVVTGSTTASGDISASGDGYFNNIRIPEGNKVTFDNESISDQYIMGTDSYITIEGDDYINLNADSSVKINAPAVTIGGAVTPTATAHVVGNIWASGSNGDITASGDISASGNMTATSMSVDTIFGYNQHGEYTNNIRTGNLIAATNNTYHIGDYQNYYANIFSTQISTNGITTIGSGTEIEVAAGVLIPNVDKGPDLGTAAKRYGEVHSEQMIATHITASGNISASGIITATSFVGNMDGGTF